MYKREDKIFVRVNRAGFIPQLGICGPIPNPIKVSCAKCLAMVNAGIDVHQVDPETRGMVKLTVENLFDDQKFANKAVAPDVTPVEKPVTPAPEPVKFTGVAKEVKDAVAPLKDINVTETVDVKDAVPEEIKPEEDTKADEVSNEDKKSDDTKSEEKPNNNNNNYNNKKNKNKNK